MRVKWRGEGEKEGCRERVKREKESEERTLYQGKSHEHLLLYFP